MNQNDFGLRLKKLRKSHNLTQAQLAKHLKISRQAYSNYEQGRTSPSTETIAQLSLILDTNLFVFFMNQNANHIPEANISSKKRIDPEEFNAFFQVYSQLSVLSRSRLLNLMILMVEGGDS